MTNLISIFTGSGKALLKFCAIPLIMSFFQRQKLQLRYYTMTSIEHAVILGFGNFGREVYAWAQQSNLIPLGFLDDQEPEDLKGLRYLGSEKWLDEYRNSEELRKEFLMGDTPNVILGIGSPQAKRVIYERLKDKVNFINVIHPSTIFGNSVKIEANSGLVITPGNIVTSDITIGKLAMINLSCTVGHDCSIGDFVTISPGVNVSGRVKVGEGAYLGTGSTILEGISIGCWSVLGGQALAVKDLPDNTTAVGVPAKVIKHREEGWHL